MREQFVRRTNTSATWVCVYLHLRGVMVTWIVLTGVMKYLVATAVSFCSFNLYRLCLYLVITTQA